MNNSIEEIPYTSNIESIIKKEQTEDVKNLVKDIEQLKEIMKDINELIEDDEKEIAYAELISDETQQTLENTQITIDKAREAQKKAVILKGTLISTCIGACIGGPLGGILGNTAGVTIMGALIGSISFGGFSGSLTNYILKTK